MSEAKRTTFKDDGGDHDNDNDNDNTNTTYVVDNSSDQDSTLYVDLISESRAPPSDKYVKEMGDWSLDADEEMDNDDTNIPNELGPDFFSLAENIFPSDSQPKSCLVKKKHLDFSSNKNPGPRSKKKMPKAGESEDEDDATTLRTETTNQDGRLKAPTLHTSASATENEDDDDERPSRAPSRIASNTKNKPRITKSNAGGTSAEITEDRGQNQSNKTNPRANKKPPPPKKKSKKPQEVDDSDVSDTDDGLGAVVYQIEVRFIIFKGVHFCGGIRVLLNCPEETAYIQLITLMNEVFATYDITSIYFLEPRSAAGVSFCGIPHDTGKDNEGDDDDDRKKRRGKDKKSSCVIDHAQVVFCNPDQKVRFQTVIDTLLCAVRGGNSNNGVDLQNNRCEENECVNNNTIDPANGGDVGSSMPIHDDDTTWDDAKLIKSVGANAISSGPGGYPCTTAINVTDNSTGADSPTPRLVAGSDSKTGGHHISFDPCPKGPAGMVSMCLPCDLGDPYQLYPVDGRIVFCTPACLKVCCRSGKKMIYKGKLKIVQGTGGIGFIIRIESNDRTTLYSHSLRRDLVLYATNDVQFGFCYSTVVCTAGRTCMETFTVAFPSSYQRDQFKHAVNTCKDILGMTSAHCLMSDNDIQ